MDDSHALYNAVRKALSCWDKHNADPETLLGDLLSVQEERKKLKAGENPAILRAATNQVLKEANQDLEKQNPRCARVLKLRFMEKYSINDVANMMNFSSHQISRLQRDGIEQLIEIIQGREEGIKREQAQSLESLLPPPTFSRLFGVDDLCDRLLNQLTIADAPWVIALVGLGGLGKTAVANRIARQLIQQLHFGHIAWIKAAPPHSFSGQSESPSLTYEKIVSALLAQILPDDDLPFSLPEREVKLRQVLKSYQHLVVIDNLEAVEDTSFLLNHLHELASPSKFILTTRTRAAKQAGVLDVSLQELSCKDSMALMRHQAEETGVTAVADATDADLQQIIDQIGGNPFALKIVVNLLDVLPLNRLLDGLTRNHPGQVMEMYKHIFWQTWQTLSENGRKLLQSMPLALEPADVDYLLTISGLSEGEIWPAIEELRQRSLLEVEGGLHEKRYGIHRLTDTFLRTEIIHFPL
ncbi:MAG: hypothetical protein H6656_19270 [Ardenticatenaceae bacterium]|nr:hypothetical protein [Ardenticatenaceae bacterium]